MKGTEMLNKMLMLAVALTVAAHAADSRTPAQRCADRRVATVLAQAVMKTACEPSADPSLVLGDALNGDLRGKYWNFATSPDRGEERNQTLVVEKCLVVRTGDHWSYPYELMGVVAAAVEDGVVTEQSDGTKVRRPLTVADATIVVAQHIYDALPTYRESGIRQEDMVVLLAEGVVAGFVRHDVEVNFNQR